MGIGTGSAALIGGLSAAGGIASSAIGASAAGHAADTQANAAMNAAQLQHQDAQSALDFQKQQFQTSQQNIAPWLNVGRGGLANLGYLMGLPLGPTSTTRSDGFTNGVQPLGNGSAGRGGTFTDLPGGRHVFPMSTLMTDNGGPSQVANDSGGFAGPQGMSLDNSQVPSNTNQVSLSSLVNPSLGAPGSLMAPWTEQFKAPDAITEQNDPGFQARLKLSQDVLERSAAARGNVLTGGTAKDLAQFGQDYASNEYSNVYNRSFNDYTTRYNTFKQNQADQFNRLASISGIGQTAAGQLAQNGQLASNNTASILLNSGAQIGQQLNNAGAARASGYVGSANAIGNGITGATNNLSNYMLLPQLMNGGGGSVSAAAGNYGDLFQGPCWIAAELYGGWLEQRTRLIREWLRKVYRFDPLGSAFYDWYEQHGERVAAEIRADHTLRPGWQQFFDGLLAQARQWAEVTNG